MTIQGKDLLASGLTDDEPQQVWETTKGLQFGTLPGSLRVPDFASYLRSQGPHEFCPLTEISIHAYLGPRFATRARMWAICIWPRATPDKSSPAKMR